MQINFIGKDPAETSSIHWINMLNISHAEYDYTSVANRLNLSSNRRRKANLKCISDLISYAIDSTTLLSLLHFKDPPRPICSNVQMICF